MPGDANGRTGMSARTQPGSVRMSLVGLGLGCWAAAIALYVVAVRTAPGRLADDAAFQQLRDTLSTRSWIPAGSGLAAAQLTLLVVGAGVMCATCLVNRCSPRTTAAALVLGCAPGALADVLKGALPRPTSPVEFAAHNSFPSGTVAAFAGLAAALMFVANSRLQQGIAAAAWTGTGFVSLVVIRAHWHRPSDVAGALLIAVGAWAIIAGLVAPYARRSQHREPSRSPAGRPVTEPAVPR